MANVPIHNVFTTTYNSLALELRTEATIKDPILGNELKVTKAIWDTGATGSAITLAIATKLGLVPTGQVEVFGATGGSKIVNTYVVSLKLPSQVEDIRRDRGGGRSGF